MGVWVAEHPRITAYTTVEGVVAVVLWILGFESRIDFFSANEMSLGYISMPCQSENKEEEDPQQTRKVSSKSPSF